MMNRPFHDRGNNEAPFRRPPAPASTPSRARQDAFYHPGLTPELDAILAAYSDLDEVDDADLSPEQARARMQALDSERWQREASKTRIEAKRAAGKGPENTEALSDVLRRVARLEARIESLEQHAKPTYDRRPRP